MSMLPAPPKPIKRKRIPLESPVQRDVVPTPTKRKRTAEEIKTEQPPPTSKKRATTTTTGGKLSKGLLNKITYGTTRKQRHTILGIHLYPKNQMHPVNPFSIEMMIKAVQKVDDCPVSEEGLLAYFSRVERRLYDGVFGKTMNACYNMYRADLYRKFAFEIIYALRANGGVHGLHLMQQYEPELLASLPAPFLADGTPAGKVYNTWKKKQDDALTVEEEMRRARHETKGEGWLRCYKCGGRFEMRELQMRGGDEPATIFRSCQNCGFTKRNG